MMLMCDRGSGKSFARYLIVIGTALQTPFEWVEFVDHVPMNSRLATWHRNAIQDFCLRAGIKNIEIRRVQGKCIEVRSKPFSVLVDGYYNG